MDNSQGLQYDDALMGNPFADAVSPPRDTEEQTSIQQKEPEQEQQKEPEQEQQKEEQEAATTTTTTATTSTPPPLTTISNTVSYDEEYQHQQHQQQVEEEYNIPITSSPTSSIHSNHNNENMNQDKNNIVESMASLNVENQAPLTIPDVPSTIDNGSEYSQVK